VSCPSCFARVFDGTAFCPFCGERQARGAAVPGEAPCPSCRTALHGVDVGATRLLECGTCDGVWVDADIFEALCADRGSQPPVLHHLAARGVVRTGERVRYRPCVRCGKMMNRVNFGRVSGTVVDVCRGHGTFLDAGELEAILAFIRAGGLDQARAREMRELQDERRRLERAQGGPSSAPRGRITAGPARGLGSAWDARSLLDLLERIRKR
jgi:Zn-finger nucleic acid-binding protein